MVNNISLLYMQIDIYLYSATYDERKWAWGCVVIIIIACAVYGVCNNYG